MQAGGHVTLCKCAVIIKEILLMFVAFLFYYSSDSWKETGRAKRRGSGGETTPKLLLYVLGARSTR